MHNKKSTLTRAVLHGAFWAFASKYTGRFLAFITTIILARLLTQEDFGVASYAFLVINYLEVMRGLGIGPALIYHERDPERTASGFWLGLGMGAVLFGLTWLIAPLVGYFFNDMRATPVIRALTLTFPIAAMNTVPYALLRKNLAFKRIFLPDFAMAMGKGLIAIILALLGFGVWSLIVGQMAGTLFMMIALWWIVPWRPLFTFKLHLARSLLSYGLNIISVRLVRIVLTNMDYILVGRYLGIEALGVYTLAFRIPEFLILQFATVISQVLFPAYAKMRHDPAALRRGYLTTVSYVSIVAIPVGLGLALVAKPFVLTLLTEKWAETIPIMSAISISAVIRVLTFNSGEVYKAQGRPEILRRVQFIRLALLTPLLWWAVTGPGTLTAVAWSYATVTGVATMTHIIIIKQVLGIPIKTTMGTLRPAVISGAVMTLMVWGTLLLLTDALQVVQLVVSVTVGALTYGSVLWWLQRDTVIRAGHTLRAALVRR